MTSAILSQKQRKIISEIPPVKDFSNIHIYTTKSKDDADFILLLNSIIGINDINLSKWLNITPRIYRNYKNNSEITLKDSTKEHIILILSLYKHGAEVFGNVENFEKWLQTRNFFLDHKAPISFLETISGIKFIDDRLAAIEYGDNA